MDDLIQLHWQNPKNTDESEFIAQGGEFRTDNEMQDCIRATFGRHLDSKPAGWVPMVCNSDSDHFVWAEK